MKFVINFGDTLVALTTVETIYIKCELVYSFKTAYIYVSKIGKLDSLIKKAETIKGFCFIIGLIISVVTPRYKTALGSESKAF